MDINASKFESFATVMAGIVVTSFFILSNSGCAKRADDSAAPAVATAPVAAPAPASAKELAQEPARAEPAAAEVPSNILPIPPVAVVHQAEPPGTGQGRVSLREPDVAATPIPEPSADASAPRAKRPHSTEPLASSNSVPSEITIHPSEIPKLEPPSGAAHLVNNPTFSLPKPPQGEGPGASAGAGAAPIVAPAAPGTPLAPAKEPTSEPEPTALIQKENADEQARQKFEFVWNTWFERNGKSERALVGGRGYDLALDLSKYAYTSESAVNASSSFNGTIAVAIKEKQKSLKLTIRAIFIDDTFHSAAGAKTADTFIVDINKVTASSAVDEELKSLGALTNGKSLKDMSEMDGYLRFRLPVTVTAGVTRCAQIAFSVWDEGDFRPLDHIVLTVPVVANESDAMEPNCRVDRVQGGFGALAGAFSSQGDVQADAALQVFEFTDSQQLSRTRAVYIDIAEYKKGNTESGGSSSGVYSWELTTLLSNYIGGVDLLGAIESARKTESYVRVGNELKGILFPSDGDGQALAAFHSLSNLPKHDGQVSFVFVRAISLGGQLVYPPMSMLAATGEIKNPFVAAFPLQRENYSTKSCVKRWTLGYPDVLNTGTNLREPLPLDERTAFLPDSRTVRLHNYEDLNCYMDISNSSCRRNPPIETQSTDSEGLLLLAHQSNGFVWFTKDTSGWPRVSMQSESRKFLPGSVAFLTACSMASPIADNQAIIRQLNRNGIDAVVASPFAVDVAYGKYLAIAAIEVMRTSFDDGREPTILEIFELAADRVAKDYPAHNMGARRLEFVLIGNPQIRMCK